MSWPLSQDYNEAIQSPETSFADPELKQGEVVCNALGIPLPRSGNFADVYEFRCTNSTRWAIKCFTRQVAGLRERYQEISRALQDAKLPFTVEFTYQQEGILIRGQWYPILKMQWVEGFTFNEFVRQHLDKPAMMDGLLQIWGRMSQRLRAAGIAHADLQHGNVLLVPGSTANSLAVKLIDYDGMFVPTLAGKPSGEVGHPSYQHPQRVREGIYSPEVDRFPLLLIAASLRCVRAGGRALWERHDNGDNLLFRESDLKAPETSKLFEELSGLGDAKAKTLVGLVRQALAGAYDRVPLLEEVLPDLANVTTAPAPKPVRPAPAAAPAGAIAVAVPPPRIAPAPTDAVTAVAPAAIALAADPFDYDEPGRRRQRRGGKQAKSSLALWIGGAVAFGVVFVGGLVTILVLLTGKSKPSAPATDQQAAVQRDKDAGAAAPKGKDTNKPPVNPPKDPGKDPMMPPEKDPPRDPIPDPLIPIRVEDGVFRLRHTLAAAGPARSVAVSADGKLGLSCTNGDGTINLWDLDTGTLTELKTPYSAVSGLAFLPDNKTILFSANDAKLHRMNLTKPAQDQPGKQWTQLFNGKDLTGWKTHPDDKTLWSVKDGILVGEGPPGLLFTNRNDFTSFHLRVSAQINEGGDSGIFFRVGFARSTVNTVPAAYEAQIDGKSISQPTPGRTGSLFIYAADLKLTPEEMAKLRIKDVLIKPNEWFTYEVIAVGNHIVIKVNDKTTVDFVDKTNLFRKGHLAIQQSGVKGSIVSIRKAEVMDLAEDAVVESEPREPFGGGSPEGHPTKVDCLDVSADGKIALTGCHDKIRAWNLDTDKRLPGEWPRVGLPTVSLSIAAHARVAVSHHTMVHILVWDIDSGTRLMTFGDPSRGGNQYASAISPDGKMVVTGTDTGEIVLHDVEKRVVNARKLANLGMSVKALAVSADGRYLAAAGSSPTTKVLAILDMASGKELQRFDNTSVLPGLLKFATGSNCLLASGGDGKVRVFDVVKGNPDPVVRNPDAGPSRLEFYSGVDALPNIRCLTTAKDGQVITVHDDGSIRRWTITKESIQVAMKLADPKNTPIQHAAVGGHVVLFANQKGVLHTIDMDAAKFKPLADLGSMSIQSLDVSGNDSVAVVSATFEDRNEVIVFDLLNNKEYTRITMPGPTKVVRLLTNGNYLLTGGSDSCLNVWESRTGKLMRKVWQGQAPVHSVATPPGGKLVLVADQSGITHAIETASGKERYHLDRPPDQALGSLGISPSGAVGMVVLLKGQRSNLEFFDVESGRKLGLVEEAFKDWALTTLMFDDEHLLYVPTPPNKVDAYAIRLVPKQP